MRKCCFIIPYFGKLPNYFQLFLKSCEYNPDFNWLVFTDDMTAYKYPDNVLRIKMSFEELRQLVQSKFDFTICLSKPYKLCDYKPAYGYIFEEYLSNYQAWGHCDVDVVLGHLNDFISDRDLGLYDKMFCLGHMVIYKNTRENNRVFMSSFRGSSLYKESFTTDKITVFDEEGISYERNINQIFLDEGKRVYEVDHSLNINNNRLQFRRTVFKGNTEYPNRCGFEAEPYRPSVYLWDKGFVNRYFMYDGKLIKGNYPYIHLQGRKMTCSDSVLGSPVIQIVPNSFILPKNLNVNISNFSDFLQHGKTKDFYHALIKEKYENIKRFLKRKLNG